MKIVNITDIESIVESKLEIDKLLIDNNEQKEKMQLNEYMQKYCALNKCAYVYHSDIIPFAYYSIYGNKYLFVASNSELTNNIVDKLKSINYDYSKLKKISISDIAKLYENPEEHEYYIINNVYYR